jgi:hypothetical protein
MVNHLIIGIWECPIFNPLVYLSHCLPKNAKKNIFLRYTYAMTETPCRPATEEVSHGANVNVAEATQ